MSYDEWNQKTDLCLCILILEWILFFSIFFFYWLSSFARQTENLNEQKRWWRHYAQNAKVSLRHRYGFDDFLRLYEVEVTQASKAIALLKWTATKYWTFHEIKASGRMDIQIWIIQIPWFSKWFLLFSALHLDFGGSILICKYYHH